MPRITLSFWTQILQYGLPALISTIGGIKGKKSQRDIPLPSDEDFQIYPEQQKLIDQAMQSGRIELGREREVGSERNRALMGMRGEGGSPSMLSSMNRPNDLFYNRGIVSLLSSMAGRQLDMGNRNMENIYNAKVAQTMQKNQQNKQLWDSIFGGVGIGYNQAMMDALLKKFAGEEEPNNMANTTGYINTPSIQQATGTTPSTQYNKFDPFEYNQ